MARRVSHRPDESEGVGAKGFDAVALAVDWVPHRYERSCLGKQEKYHPVDDGQRLFEGVLESDRRSRPTGDER
jgi:hypothetical protein